MYDNMIPILLFLMILSVVATGAVLFAVLAHTNRSTSDKLENLSNRLDELTSEMDVVLPYIRETRYNVSEIAASLSKDHHSSNHDSGQ